MQIREPESFCAQLIELLSNAADKAENLGIRVDQRRANNGHAIQPRTAHATLLIHEKRDVTKRFSDNNGLTLTQIQPVLPPESLNPSGVRRFSHGNPHPESRPNRCLNRVASASLDNFTVNGWRNNQRAVNLPEKIEVGQKREVVRGLLSDTTALTAGSWERGRYATGGA